MKNSVPSAFLFLLVSSNLMAEETLDLVIARSEYILGEKHLKTYEELSAELSKTKPKELHIKPEQGIAYDRVADALKIIQKQGGISIGIAGNEKSQ